MRAADDFVVIRARMVELERERLWQCKEPDQRSRVRRLPEEIARVAQEKTRELLRRA
jgi:hypothetical protein